MKILFLHSHFSGIFRQLATLFAAQPENAIIFFSENMPQDDTKTLVALRSLSPYSRKKNKSTDEKAKQDALARAEYDMQNALARASVGARAVQQLASEGFTPDVIYLSPAMGSSLYLRDAFPHARIICHIDWYYTHSLHAALGSSHSEWSDFAPAHIRNLIQLNALTDCDVAVAASAWQKAQFPPPFLPKIAVLPSGVDTHFFCPLNVHAACNSERKTEANTQAKTKAESITKAEEEIVACSFRGIKEAHGFPLFFHSLLPLLAARPRCRVKLLGTGINPEQRVYIQNALTITLKDAAARVQLLPFCPLEEYKILLQKSTLYVYLTSPFSLSQGIFEAMSCGCLVLASATNAVKELVHHGKNAFLVQGNTSALFARQMIDLLAKKDDFLALREEARKSILTQYSATQCRQKHIALLQRLISSTTK